MCMPMSILSMCCIHTRTCIYRNKMHACTGLDNLAKIRKSVCRGHICTGVTLQKALSRNVSPGASLEEHLFRSFGIRASLQDLLPRRLSL